MTLFTDGLIVRPGRNMLDDVVTGQFDAAEASGELSFEELPLFGASRRINELNAEQDGNIISPAYPAYGIPEVRREPETPILPPAEARRRVAESGLDITIEDTGIREGALEILLERKREERQRDFVLQNAPASTIPLQMVAAFAVSAIDPINIASAFIPVVGQARYASMLASATSRAGRFGVRAKVGALQGAVGAAAIEPLILYASAQDQADYGLGDSMMNIAFGTVLGGGLHATGGLISEMRQARLVENLPVDTPDVIDVPDAAPSTQRNPLAEAISQGDESPMVALRQSFEKAIQADRQRLVEEARGQAIDEFANNLAEELEEIVSGRLPNAGTLKQEQAALQRSLDVLDERFKPLAKEFQAQRMSRKQAEKAARETIEQERLDLTAQRDEVASKLDGNRQAELARADLAKVARGEIPERYVQAIENRVEQMMRGYQATPTARAVAEAAPWKVREAALRSAVAQAVTGRPVDVDPVFDLTNPIKREAALARLKQPPAPRPEPDGAAMSQRADQAVREAANADELSTLQQALADDLAIAQEIADQVGLDLNPMLRDADALINDSATFSAAFRATALCQLRT
ncbi:MAG: hypothetical protein COA41_11355 [Sphingopyxis sp.]|nr:MAG: hypothetical protein COA41_11355 [Sphingopyxis sp.]